LLLFVFYFILRARIESPTKSEQSPTKSEQSPTKSEQSPTKSEQSPIDISYKLP